MTPKILAIVLSLIPEVPKLVQAIVDLRKAYPQLTPEQIQTIVAAVTAEADNAFDDVLAKIAADKQAHP
jgi:hypothetical protein